MLARRDIQVMILFVPELGAQERHVKPAMRYLNGRNVHYYWSTDRSVMRNFGRSIGHDIDLWDFWAIYPRDAKWSGDNPPVPAFWQHQTAGLPVGKRLDVDAFNAVLLSLADGQ